MQRRNSFAIRVQGSTFLYGDGDGDGDGDGFSVLRGKQGVSERVNGSKLD